MDIFKFLFVNEKVEEKIMWYIGDDLLVINRNK